jgi:REP element-mobilizing transposase RayT
MTVIAHHLVWTAYGTWLPNDPRGSMSRKIYTPELAELATPHFGRRKIQPSRRVVREFYEQATSRLLYSVICFDDVEIQEIGHAFAAVVKKHSYTCYACAVMPDHVHIVIRKHRHSAEEIIEHFQRASRVTECFIEQYPSSHPIWTKGGWDRFLDSATAVRGRIQYVENNPVREGMPRQAWPFVKEYDGWPHHKSPVTKLNRKR